MCTLGQRIRKCVCMYARVIMYVCVHARVIMYVYEHVCMRGLCVHIDVCVCVLCMCD
jgi:hypothetical protein